MTSTGWMGQGHMMNPVSDLAETYRGAEQRLRLMLFGDGTYTAGLVTGEAKRREVAAQLRRMRNTFDASVVAPPTLVKPRDAALALGITVGSLYRAIRNGDIQAVRLTGTKRGAIRISASELQRLLEEIPQR